jgi:hypothetical protein
VRTVAIDRVLEESHVIDGRTVEVKRAIPRDKSSGGGGPRLVAACVLLFLVLVESAVGRKEMRERGRLSSYSYSYSSRMRRMRKSQAGKAGQDSRDRRGKYRVNTISPTTAHPTRPTHHVHARSSSRRCRQLSARALSPPLSTALSFLPSTRG